MTDAQIQSYLDRMLDIGCGMDCRSMPPEDLEIVVAVFREALTHKSRLDMSAEGWMPVNICGVRKIRITPLTTRVDIKTEDGTIFYSVKVGDVCIGTKAPKPARKKWQWGNLSPFVDQWFGVVTHYRLPRKHSDCCSRQRRTTRRNP